jgi:hypothetical protein
MYNRVKSRSILKIFSEQASIKGKIEENVPIAMDHGSWPKIGFGGNKPRHGIKNKPPMIDFGKTTMIKAT